MNISSSAPLKGAPFAPPEASLYFFFFFSSSFKFTAKLRGRFPGSTVIRNAPAVQELWVQSLLQEGPRRRKWQPTPVNLPGKSRGQKSLVGYSLWSGKDLGMTEQTQAVRTN